MADQIVSVRMPKGLLEELRLLAEKNHFLDVSEEVRSLLREKWMLEKDPYSVQLQSIRKNIAKTTIPEKLSTLKGDLKKLLEEINELS